MQDPPVHVLKMTGFSQLPLALPIYDVVTFADFQWGNNVVVKGALENALYHQGKDKFFYIWGPAGIGKTHILQAACNAMPPTSAIYLPLDLLKLYGADSMQGMSDYGLIAIDNIEAVAGDKAFEEALFHLYNRAHDAGTIVLVSSRYSPAASPIHLLDLRSRLSMMLVTQLHPLEDHIKINILQKQAKQRGFTMPASVGRFLLNHYARDMHALIQALDTLDHASLAAKRKITVPFVKTVLV